MNGRLLPEGGSLTAAVSLSVVAGFVDAVGFLVSGGAFVSFMSGNTTRLAVGIADGSHIAVISGGLIGAFLLGVILGAICGRLAGGWRRPAVLALVTLLLATAASLAPTSTWPAVLILALAMGAENTVFAENGDVRFGVTYMTGTLVRMGKRIALIPFGGDPWAWAPFMGLWFGLLVGALGGAVAWVTLGPVALWAAAAAMAALMIASFIRDRPDRTPHPANT